MEPIEKDDHFILDRTNVSERNIKRTGDCILAPGVLTVLLPLFLLRYIAMKREDGGLTIFEQECIGCFGRLFNIYKFRSMKLDVEKYGLALHAGEEDSRTIKTGCPLHDHRLDEFLQLWNVFCGDMVLIGPRPERQFFINQIMKEDPRYRYLFQIHSDVTSYVILYNGYTDTSEKMLRCLHYDLFYLEYRLRGSDIKIPFMTFMNIAFEKKF